jgi:hypothetical protein
VSDEVDVFGAIETLLSIWRSWYSVTCYVRVFSVTEDCSFVLDDGRELPYKVTSSLLGASEAQRA